MTIPGTFGQSDRKRPEMSYSNVNKTSIDERRHADWTNNGNESVFIG